MAENITSAFTPDEYFEAGHKLMVERAEIQRREEALEREYKRGWSDGCFVGFLLGAAFGLLLWLIFR